MEAQAIAHPNIALVKYWGKDNEKLNTPLHGSLSVTLDFGTTITHARYSNEEQFLLNGSISEITPRLQKALTFFETKTGKKFHVESTNSFPTASGFASSASGAAAFVTALASLAGETEQPLEYWRERNVSLESLARQVSGSGCRSLYGGFVEWTPGDDSFSVSKPIHDEKYWPEFTALSITFQSKQKSVSSSEGMQRSVHTVPWIQYRAQEIVPKRIFEAKRFIGQKDFNGLAEITMRESNDLHANCLASYPAIHYLNDESYRIIDAIQALNQENGRNVAAYTFDAGPNPFIFTLESDLPLVQKAISFVELDRIKQCKPATGTKSELL